MRGCGVGMGLGINCEGTGGEWDHLVTPCRPLVWVWCVCCSFKDEKHLVFGFEEFPQFLVDYLDCCIEQDNDDEREWVLACPWLYLLISCMSEYWLVLGLDYLSVVCVYICEFCSKSSRTWRGLRCVYKSKLCRLLACLCNGDMSVWMSWLISLT